MLALILVLLVGLVLSTRRSQPPSRIATASSTTIPPTTTGPVVKTTAPTTTEAFHPSPTVAVTEPSPSPSPSASGAAGQTDVTAAGEPAGAAAPPGATTAVPEPPPSTAAPRPVASVAADASVADTRAGPGDEQRVDVRVVDQDRQAVAGATVLVTIVYPGNKRETYAPPPTDANGHTEQAFVVRQGIKKGSRIDVEVTTSYNGHDDTTRTSWKVH